MVISLGELPLPYRPHMQNGKVIGLASEVDEQANVRCLEQPFMKREAPPVQGSLRFLLALIIKLKMVPCSLAPWRTQ